MSPLKNSSFRAFGTQIFLKIGALKPRFPEFFSGLALIAILCSAQIAAASKIDAQNVKLAIDLTKDTLRSGTTNLVSVQIQNLSTNSIYVVELNPATDTVFFLIDQQGNEHRLTPLRPKSKYSSVANVYPYTRRLNEGETYKCISPLIIPEGMDRGEFSLKAIRYYIVGKSREPHQMLSNILTVSIK